MTGREHVAQGLPPVDLGRFPAHAVPRSTVLYRAHGAGMGPWWFGNDGRGRIDLADPHGTCYTSLDADSAVRERLGPVLAGRSTVPRRTRSNNACREMPSHATSPVVS